jgi:hypothetical protein
MFSAVYTFNTLRIDPANPDVATLVIVSSLKCPPPGSAVALGCSGQSWQSGREGVLGPKTAMDFT